MAGPKRRIHDDQCAITLDVPSTPGDENSNHRAPACTCEQRQKNRLRYQGVARTNSGGGQFPDGAKHMGSGNYWTTGLTVEY